MTDSEAVLSALALVSREAEAQRRRADALLAWQDAVAGALAPFLDGQPEVRAGAPVARVIGEFVARLVRERDAARGALPGGYLSSGWAAATTH